MITNKNLRVGQTVFIQVNGTLEQLRISQIGRQYIYLDDCWKSKIAIELIYPNTNCRSALFLSHDDFLEYEKLNKDKRFIEEYFSGYKQIRLTASQAKRIRAIIEEPDAKESEGGK